jgi:protein-S-isoprenylcysteine O-methyltransferase Ste14
MLRLLPVLVFLRLALGALRSFTPPSGRRDPRSYLIVLSFWATLIASWWAAPGLAWLEAVGVAGLIASLALFQWAALSIRGLHFSYVFTTDVPAFLHTSGPYVYIRNPFYTSYLLAIVSTAVMFPSPATAATAVAMTVYFDMAARFEERKFHNSPLRDEFAAYKARTGRFLPRLSRS